MVDLGKSQKQKAKILDLMLMLYINLAACYLRRSDLSNAMAACNEALALDPNNQKALYRRSKCYSMNVNVSTDELKLAVKDLKTAYKLKPQKKILQELQRVRAELQKIKADENESLKGMFFRKLSPKKA